MPSQTVRRSSQSAASAKPSISSAPDYSEFHHFREAFYHASPELRALVQSLRPSQTAGAGISRTNYNVGRMVREFRQEDPSAASKLARHGGSDAVVARIKNEVELGLHPDSNQVFADYGPMVHGFAQKLYAPARAVGLTKEDLVAAGKLGLHNASKAFDSHRGVRFITLAYYESLNAMRRILRDFRPLTKTGASLVRDYDATHDALVGEFQRVPSHEAIVERMNLSEDRRRILEASLAITNPLEDQAGPDRLEDYVPDPHGSARFDRVLGNHSVRQLLNSIPDVQAREAFKLHVLDGMTQAQVAKAQAVKRHVVMSRLAAARNHIRAALADGALRSGERAKV